MPRRVVASSLPLSLPWMDVVRQQFGLNVGAKALGAKSGYRRLGDHSHMTSASAVRRFDPLTLVQGLPFGDCLLLSALLHIASSAAGHTVE